MAVATLLRAEQILEGDYVPGVVQGMPRRVEGTVSLEGGLRRRLKLDDGSSVDLAWDQQVMKLPRPS